MFKEIFKGTYMKIYSLKSIIKTIGHHFYGQKTKIKFTGLKLKYNYILEIKFLYQKYKIIVYCKICRIIYKLLAMI